MGMEVTLGDLRQAQPALAILMQMDDIPSGCGYRLALMMKDFDKHLEASEGERKKLIEKHGTPTDNGGFRIGTPILDDDGKTKEDLAGNPLMSFSDADLKALEAFRSDFDTLNAEAVTLGCSPVKLPADIKMKPALLLQCDPFVIVAEE